LQPLSLVHERPPRTIPPEAILQNQTGSDHLPKGSVGPSFFANTYSSKTHRPQRPKQNCDLFSPRWYVKNPISLFPLGCLDLFSLSYPPYRKGYMAPFPPTFFSCPPDWFFNLFSFGQSRGSPPPGSFGGPLLSLGSPQGFKSYVALFSHSFFRGARQKALSFCSPRTLPSLPSP